MRAMELNVKNYKMYIKDDVMKILFNNDGEVKNTFYL